MIFIILGVCIALACYRMGIIIGKAIAYDEFNQIRKELDMDTTDEVWNRLWYGDD